MKEPKWFMVTNSDGEENDVLKDIVGEPDCSECGGPCTGCNLRHIRFANRFAICMIIFMILFFGLMFFTL